MKKIFLLPLLAIIFSGCYRTIETMSNTANNAVLSYPVVNQYNIAASGINYWNKALLNLDFGKKTDTLRLSINIREALSQPITFNIGINEAAVTNYNRDTLFGSTQYQLLPADKYNIVSPSVVFEPRRKDSIIKIAIAPSSIDISTTGYILPVSITSANGINVSEMNTVYFHIEKDPFPPYSVASWTVVGFSSEEAAGEGAGNGRVVNIFDNDVTKFWHSKWQGGNDPLPYWFTIDMHTAQVLHGVTFLDRQGVGSNGRPKNMKVEVSNDLTTWTTAGSFTAADQNTSWQKINFSSPTSAVRYFRITISSVYGDVSYANLAELKVF